MVSVHTLHHVRLHAMLCRYALRLGQARPCSDPQTRSFIIKSWHW